MAVSQPFFHKSNVQPSHTKPNQRNDQAAQWDLFFAIEQFFPKQFVSKIDKETALSNGLVNKNALNLSIRLINSKKVLLVNFFIQANKNV